MIRTALAMAAAFLALAGTAHAQLSTQASSRYVARGIDSDWQYADHHLVAAADGDGAVLAWTESLGPLREGTVHVASLAAAGGPTVLSGLPRDAFAHDIAFRPGQGGLVVASGAGALWGQRLDAAGRPTGAAFAIAAAEPSTSVTVASAAPSGSDGWVVAWAAQRRDAQGADVDAELRAVAVAADGTAGTPSVLASGRRVTGVALAATGAGAAAAAYAVTPAEGARSTVAFQRLGADGAAVGPRRALTPGGAAPPNGNAGAPRPDLAWDGERWAVAWADGNREGEPSQLTAIRLQRVRSDGEPAGTPIVVGESRRPVGALDVAVAAHADATLLTWNDKQQVQARAVRTAGDTLVDERPAAIVDVPDLWAPGGSGLTASGDTFWLAADVYRWSTNPTHRDIAGVHVTRVGVDRAPDTTLAETPAKLHKFPTGTLAWTSTDPDATYRCIVDPMTADAEAVPCTSPQRLTLKESWPHRIEVRATGANGWTEAVPATYAFMVDDFDPPGIFVDQVPPRKTTARWARFWVRSDEDTATLSCTLDGVAVPCGPPLNLEDLPLGDHVFRVAATDAGVTGPTTEYRWTIFSIEDADARTAPPAPALVPALPVAPVVALRAPGAKVTVGAKACAPRSRAKRCVAARKAARAKARARARARAKARARARAGAKAKGVRR